MINEPKFKALVSCDKISQHVWKLPGGRHVLGSQAEALSSRRGEQGTAALSRNDGEPQTHISRHRASSPGSEEPVQGNRALMGIKLL